MKTWQIKDSTLYEQPYLLQTQLDSVKHVAFWGGIVTRMGFTNISGSVVAAFFGAIYFLYPWGLVMPRFSSVVSWWHCHDSLLVLGSFCRLPHTNKSVCQNKSPNLLAGKKSSHSLQCFFPFLGKNSAVYRNPKHQRSNEARLRRQPILQGGEPRAEATPAVLVGAAWGGEAR